MSEVSVCCVDWGRNSWKSTAFDCLLAVKSCVLGLSVLYHFYRQKEPLQVSK